MLLASASLAFAASAPSFTSESVSHLTATDATLEAQIDPNGLETTYEFHLASPACQREWPLVGPCLAISGFSLPSAIIPAQSGVQTVSINLSSAGHSLQPGTWYEYAVTASNAAGEVTGHNVGEGPGVGHNYAGGGGEQNFETLSDAPVIESESLSHLTPTDATLEAQINTEGLETTYEFELQTVECSSHGAGCELAPHSISLPSGTLLGSFVGQEVSLDLNRAGITLGKGEWFYTVAARNDEGSATGTFHQFEAPSAEPQSSQIGAVDDKLPAGVSLPLSLSSTPPAHHKRHKRRRHAEPRSIHEPLGTPRHPPRTTPLISHSKLCGGCKHTRCRYQPPLKLRSFHPSPARLDSSGEYRSDRAPGEIRRGGSTCR